MIPEEPPAPTRRARRAQTGALPVTAEAQAQASGTLTADEPGADEPGADEPGTDTATTALDPSSSSAVPDATPAGTTTARGGTLLASESSPGTLFPPDQAPRTLLSSEPVPGALLGPEPDASTLLTARQAVLTAETPVTASAGPERFAREAPSGSSRTALTWIDDRTIGLLPPPDDLSAAATPYVPVEADLLADAPRRSLLRAGVVVPTLAIAGLAAAYSATTLLWPLHAVAPTVVATEVQSVAAPATTPAWPGAGSAAIAVDGIGVTASTVDPSAIASITKIVTALVVLDAMPLAVGEQGPEYRFTFADSDEYWDYRANGESALDVPVDGSLTQYQMLEGMLIGSANNYADRLADTIWPNDTVFASAANAWLASRGVTGITIVEPTGMDERNSATPEALIALAQKAMANPVIAEIVAKPSVELPGAGLVENTNGLLADAGVVGIKTGTLDAWNLLSAKDVTIGDTAVRLYAAVLGQPDDESRLAASRALYAQLESELQLKPSVTAGTLAGRVETLWGDPVDIVTDADASVVLWNGGAGAVSVDYSLGGARDEGDTVGALSVTGPLNSTSVSLRLASDIEDPSPWWRLTHPLDLFGLNG